jgi:hypothetical protein
MSAPPIPTATWAPEPANPDALKDVELGSDPEVGGVPVTHPDPLLQKKSAAASAAPSSRYALGSLYALSFREQVGLLTFTALVEMIMAAQLCAHLTCSSMVGYEVTLGAVSALITLVTIAVDYKNALDPEPAQLIVGAVWLWWFIGVIVATFFGNFTTTIFANGYFFSWASFVVATVTFVQISARARSATTALTRWFGQGYSPLLWPLFLSSAVVMGAAINPCTGSTPAASITGLYSCTGTTAFALALGTVSMFVCLVLIAVDDKLSDRAMRFVAVLLALWWIVGTGIVTFSSPFVFAGCVARFSPRIAALGGLTSRNTETAISLRSSPSSFRLDCARLRSTVREGARGALVGRGGVVVAGIVEGGEGVRINNIYKAQNQSSTAVSASLASSARQAGSVVLGTTCGSAMGAGLGASCSRMLYASSPSA